MYSLIRPLLFRLDPELVHAFTLKTLRIVGSVSPLSKLILSAFPAPSIAVDIFGLTFSNQVGLAAGYDKDALAWRGLAALGFGHIEIGTVTLKPQSGNDKPRLFRLPEDRALINRMGFPSLGAEFVAQQLQGSRPKRLVLGVNLGVNKDTPFEESYKDYIELLRIFASLADYLAINVSSPNTVGLRRLQGRKALEQLLSQLGNERSIQQKVFGKHLPMIVKLSPDLTIAELDDAIDVITQADFDGVILSNTSISRVGLSSPLKNERGGLSGAPLSRLCEEMVRRIHHWTNGKLPIISSGGIMSADDAKARLDAGAALLQIYTGLVYAGPGLVKSILRKVATTR